jgi:hypothetical protein
MDPLWEETAGPAFPNLLEERRHIRIPHPDPETIIAGLMESSDLMKWSAFYGT